MRTFIILLLIACVCPLGHASQEKSYNILMKSISYDPKRLEIHVGDTVDWTNKSYTDHSATSEDGKSFNTGLLPRGKSSEKIKFNSVGSFPYHCSMHGKSMSGVIIVTPQAKATPDIAPDGNSIQH